MLANEVCSALRNPIMGYAQKPVASSVCAAPSAHVTDQPPYFVSHRYGYLLSLQSNCVVGELYQNWCYCSNRNWSLRKVWLPNYASFSSSSSDFCPCFSWMVIDFWMPGQRIVTLIAAKRS